MPCSTLPSRSAELGVALLNTLYTSAVAGYRDAHPGTGAEQLDAFLHGYRTAFLAGGGLFAAALLVFLLLVNARKDPPPAYAGPDHAASATRGHDGKGAGQPSASQ